MTIIRVDIGPGDWAVVWSMGGRAPMLLSPNDIRNQLGASALCCANRRGSIPDNCPCLACSVTASWRKHIRARNLAEERRPHAAV